MEKKELTCIGCPLGCQISVVIEQGNVVEIKGNSCKIGENYARQEVTAPVRIVTSTVKVENGALPVVPVKTKSDIPKEKVFDVIKELKGIRLQAPLAIGQTVLADVCGTGVDVVATRDVAQSGR